MKLLPLAQTENAPPFLGLQFENFASFLGASSFAMIVPKEN